MHTTRPIDLAQSIFKAMNERNLMTHERNLAEHAKFDFPGAGVIEGSKRIIIFLKALLRKYPRLVFSVVNIIIEHERLCIVWHNEGESSAGTLYENRGITLVHLASDKIMLISDYFKDTFFVPGKHNQQ